MKNIARSVRHAVSCLPWRAADALGFHRTGEVPVAFVIEDADWAIRWVGEHVCNVVESIAPGTISSVTEPNRLARRVVHFGSQYMWLTWGRHLPKTNRYVVSFFHGKHADGPEVSRHIDQFLASVPRLARIVTGASLIEKRLLDWGIPREKLLRIPIGVDTRLFIPPVTDQRVLSRMKLGIPEDVYVVGSFQKDGIGWGDGMEPKVIKGPDVFLNAVTILARQVPVVVMLTGPARGFVKQGLERAGIRYVHRYVKSHAELVECYHALDLYLVTSREEGGPMGLMESMASGVPVVSTSVGMAPDLIIDGISGGLTESDDAEGLATKATQILSLPAHESRRLKDCAAKAVTVCDWNVVGRRHLEEVYRPLLDHEA